MGNRSSKKKLDTYDRCNFNVKEVYEFRMGEQDEKHNKDKITQIFCHNLEKTYFSHPNCQCANCLRTVWNVQTSIGNFKYEGKVKHHKIYSFKSSGLKIFNTITYFWNADGKGKCMWFDDVGKVSKIDKARNSNACELDAYFSCGIPTFGTIKYRDGGIYRGGFYDGKCLDAKGTEFGNDCIIVWSNGSIFKGFIPYEGAKRQLLICIGLFIPGDKHKQNNLVDYISSCDIRKIIWNYLKATVMLRFAGENEKGNSPMVVSVVY